MPYVDHVIFHFWISYDGVRKVHRNQKPQKLVTRFPRELHCHWVLSKRRPHFGMGSSLFIITELVIIVCSQVVCSTRSHESVLLSVCAIRRRRRRHVILSSRQQRGRGWWLQKGGDRGILQVSTRRVTRGGRRKGQQMIANLGGLFNTREWNPAEWDYGECTTRTWTWFFHFFRTWS